MSRAPSTFRKSDLKRACEAVQAAGIKVGKAKIAKDGSIEITAAQGAEQSSNAAGGGDIDPKAIIL